MQISLKKQKLFFIAFASTIAFFGGILNVSAFTATTTSSKYVFNNDAQFIRCVSGNTAEVMAYCNYVLSNFTTPGTHIYVSGSGLNAGVDFTVESSSFSPDRWTLIGSGVPTLQTEFIDSYGGYILSDVATVSTSTPTTTLSTTTVNVDSRVQQVFEYFLIWGLTFFGTFYLTIRFT